MSSLSGVGVRGNIPPKSPFPKGDLPLDCVELFERNSIVKVQGCAAVVKHLSKLSLDVEDLLWLSLALMNVNVVFTFEM